MVTAACGRRWYDESTGLLAGAIVATNFGYFSIGRMALPDLPLTFFITLAIWAALVSTLESERSPRKFVFVAALGLGLGFLMKGPVGLVIPAARDRAGAGHRAALDRVDAHRYRPRLPGDDGRSRCRGTC